MKKLTTVVLFITITTIVCLTTAKTAFAQGTYECSYSLEGQCYVVTDYCHTGYQPHCDNDICPLSMVSCEKITSQNCGKLDASCDPNDSTAPCCSTLTCNPQTKKCDITTTTNNIFCADNKSVNTAIGCIPTDPQGFITKFLSLAVGLGGGIAFLLIIFGGFQIMTSAGNPEKLAAGKELVSAAISGLLLIVFSLFLLRLIGYTIFKIPGFG